MVKERYFAGGVLTYLGFLLSLMCLTGEGLGSGLRGVKILLLMATIACALIAIFVLATLESSELEDDALLPLDPCAFSTPATAQANVLGAGLTFFLAFVAAMAVLGGCRSLALATGVVFGLNQFYTLGYLFAHSSKYETLDELDDARAGWVFAWVAGFFAVAAVIPVLSTMSDRVVPLWS